MNYDIRIKGRQEMLHVKDGDALKKQWENYINTKKNAIVEVSGWTGTLADIRDFIVVGAVNSDETDFEKDHRAYVAELHRLRNLPIDQKAARMGFFRLVYWAFTGKKSEDVTLPNGTKIETLAIPIQRKFFEENPLRTICDPHVYHPLIKSEKMNRFSVDVIETHIRQDSFAAAHL